jgi:hypothetical protein
MLIRQPNNRLGKQDMYKEIRIKSKKNERKFTSMQNQGNKEKK